jgi:hypothetical protein
MHSTVKRLVVLSALGTTLGIAGPVASANAAPVTPKRAAVLQGAGFPGYGFPGFVPFVPSAGLSGQAIRGQAVVGPVIITTAPSSFINTNDQVSAGGNFAGGQVAIP